MLQKREVADALLRERLPQQTVALFKGLPEALPHSFINRALKEQVSDVLLRVPLIGGEDAFVYCLVEHKRTNERAVFLQLLRYLCVIYARLEEEFPLGAVPAVVPLIVYNGLSAWPGPTRFSELPWGTPETKRLTLDFEPVVVDLRTEASETLSRDETLRGGLTALKVAAAPDHEQAELIEQAIADLRPVPSTLSLFLHYLSDVVQQRDKPRIQAVIRAQLEGDEKMYSMADAWKAEGYRRGKKKGLEKGLEQGIEQGLEQGLRESLMLVVRTRFKKASPAALKQVESASADKLPGLLERAATVKKLSDLFRD